MTQKLPASLPAVGLLALLMFSSVGAHATSWDYIIVCPPGSAWLDAADTLKSHRESYTGNCYPSGGLKVAPIADTDWIDDNYGDGDQIEETEIKEFICAVYNSQPQGEKPGFVLLIGDQSLIPEFYSLDPLDPIEDEYVDCNDDGLPDMAIGRIPAATPTEASQMIAKVIEHDTDSWRMSPASDWRNEVDFLVYDYTSIGVYQNPIWGFRIHDSVEDIWERVLPSAFKDCGPSSKGYATDIGPEEDYEAREAHAIDTIDSGAGIIPAFGTWAASFSLVHFLTDIRGFDASMLNNPGKYPVVLGMSCVLGGDDDSPSTLDVVIDMLLADQKGIVASVGPTSKVNESVALYMGESLLDRLVNIPICGEYLPLGEALRQVKVQMLEEGVSDEMTVRSMRLFGDPAMKVPVRNRFVDITHVENWTGGHPRGYRNQWVKLKVSFEDPSLPPADSIYHHYEWTADQGALDVGPCCDYHYYCWYKCSCPSVDHSSLNVKVMEGRSNTGREWFDCNYDDSTFVFNFIDYPDTSACPVVQTNHNGQWTNANSILTRLAYDAQALETEDHLWVINAPTAGTPHFTVRVTEATQGEKTLLDFAELHVVDHPSGTEIWTSQNGRFWLADSVAQPYRIWIKDGPDVTEDLDSDQDSLELTFAKGDTLYAVFRDTSTSPYQAVLKINGRTKPERYVLDVGEEEDGGWGIRTLGGVGVGGGEAILPRADWYPVIPDTPMVTRGDGVWDTVGIAIGETHRIDQIALLDGVEEWTDIVVKPLYSAIHSFAGNVTPRVASDDTLTVGINHGQYVELSFMKPPLDQGDVREFILRVVGSYGPDSLMLAGEPPANVAWGFVSYGPNPFSRQSVLHFNVTPGEECKLAVYDVTGRRIRTLVHGIAQEPHQYILWDSRDNRGHKVSGGIYFVKLEEGHRKETRKLVVLR